MIEPMFASAVDVRTPSSGGCGPVAVIYNVRAMSSFMTSLAPA